MFSELASSLCEHDLAQSLFTDFARPAFWQTLSASQRQTLIRQGEKTMQEEWPVFYASDWLAFAYTGNRADFEKRYFARRRMLNDLILAECAENEGRFLERIIDGIWLICEESAWQVPAHNSYIRDTPQLPLPDTSRPILDLFACETGALLALAHRLLKDRFAPVHAQVCRRIEQELEHRIYTPYLKDHFWWMGNGDEPMCNWTTWCTQNILISFFALPQSPETALAVVRQACTSLDCFWKDYGPDGCCREGAHYYRAAGLCLCQCLEFLTQLAPGLFDDLWNDAKLQNMVAFVLHMHVGGEYYLNYADCSPKIGPCGVREYLFAARTGCTELMSLAAEQYQSQPLPPSSMNGVNLFYRLQELVLDEVVRRHPMTPIHHGEVYYPSTGIWITRDQRYCLSAKAGCNADSHNHNDTGSLIVYLNEKPFLIDIGVESYSKKTFSPQRYEIWTMQSAWHNLPTFDGVMQEFGPQYGAGTVNSQFGTEKSSFSMELAAAWPKEAHLSRYMRTVTLYKGSHIEVQEQCSGTFHTAVLSLLFCQEPCVAGPDQLQTADGLIQFAGAQGIQIESVAVTDARLRAIWGETLWRAQVTFSHDLTWKIR